MREEAAGWRYSAWTEAEFEGSRDRWQELLARSNADPLFNSWDWQWRWWRHNAGYLHARLHIEAISDAAGRLLALVPLYVRRGYHRLFYGERWELLGRAWRSPRAVFSEYGDVLIDRDFEERLIPVIASRLWHAPGWVDLVLSNVKTHGSASRIARELGAHGGYARVTDHLNAYAIRLSSGYEEVLKGLSANTRRRVHNQRKRLSSPMLRQVTPAEIGATLDLIDDFHRTRWGRQVQSIHSQFHQDFATAMAQTGALRMTRLEVDGKLLSAMYNVRANDTEYNIQQAFDPDSLHGVSPGYLHFGFCIEAACGDELRTFDFLAGGGRQRDYKTDFRPALTELVTWQVIRKQPLAWLYRQYDERLRSGGDLVRA